MRWWIPFNNLRPIQQAIINGVTNNPNRPHWIKGFAGTGKSLILMNLMERMASLHPQASLCFITYTNSLLELVKSAPVYHQILNHAVIQTYREFLNNGKKFNYVFLDEVQDINLADLNRIKTLADHLYFAGDS
ncbi:MAG: ATP-binding protein, partial [Candidatus Adiutrix sp.]|nr:ATP-binding protein [Candidatus Adiutrix sp.]